MKKRSPTQEALIIRQILLVSTKGNLEKSMENIDADVKGLMKEKNILIE